MNSSGPISPKRLVLEQEKQAAQRMPKVYRDLFIGRVTRKEESGVITEGVVMTYKHLNIKHDPEDDEKYIFDITYIVVWATPEDPMKREEFADQELQQSGYLTMRFTEETWFNPTIRHLQRAGWDESKVDVTERDFDCMTWQALRMPSIAKKAAVHAHAMNAALLGKEFVIPPAPGLPVYEKLEDIPSLIPPRFYDAPCLARNDVQPPVAWKLKDKRPISQKDRQRGRAAAAYVQALKLQAVVHKATLGKLRKESENVAQRLSATQQLAVLRDALTSWDADTETNSEESREEDAVGDASGGRDGVVQEVSGVLMNKKQLTAKIREAEKRVAALTPTEELPNSDEARLKAIARQEAAIARTLEMAELAEQRLKAFQEEFGLIRTRGKGQGMHIAKTKADKAPGYRKVPKPLASVPKKSVVKLKRDTANKAGSMKKQAGKARNAVASGDATDDVSMIDAGNGSSVSGEVATAVSSDSDGIIEQPTEKELALWPGQKLVRAQHGGFFPKRLVMEEGDMPLEEWLRKESTGELAASGDFEVEALAAERTLGKKRQFLVKWKGYELHSDQWEPLKHVKDCTALDDWEHLCTAAKQRASGKRG
ncbi:hypothetical protein CVIRNUC_009725 [Coccomyxa viridis]|uniref:Chromo domain-containing protein n=1 Tax=Coccomyxa viridis TaxID=1274662 RepID=A0AAV1IH36_9CHLO|nr:hypothetical protein CVIRNUC_009725 [Coccomyxa viridis]